MSCIAFGSLIIAIFDFLPFLNIVWLEMRVTAIIKYNNAKLFYISTCFISLIYFVCLWPIIYFTNYIDITWLVIIGHIYLTVLPIFIFRCFFFFTYDSSSLCVDILCIICLSFKMVYWCFYAIFLFKICSNVHVISVIDILYFHLWLEY